VEILLCYDDPRYDLVLPVPASPSTVKAPQPTPPAQEERSGETGKPLLRQKKGPRL
jgi:hypothetical protein